LNWVIDANCLVVFRELGAQTPHLDANPGVSLRVEIGPPTEDLCRDLILLYVFRRRIECVVSQELKKLAERIGTRQKPAIHQTLNPGEANVWVHGFAAFTSRPGRI
jgi:hypothetical protein